MAFPNSGIITSIMINAELARPSWDTIHLNDPEVRALAERPSGTISFSDFYGKSLAATVRLEMLKSIVWDYESYWHYGHIENSSSIIAPTTMGGGDIVAFFSNYDDWGEYPNIISFQLRGGQTLSSVEITGEDFQPIVLPKDRTVNGVQYFEIVRTTGLHEDYHYLLAESGVYYGIVGNK